MAISRRAFIASAAVLSGAAAGLWRYVLPPRKRPNILLIIADDLRHDALGYMGNPIVSTPSLDALASQQAVIFRNSFTTTAICPVSRASILTGQYASRHKIFDYDTDLPEPGFEQSYPYLLRREGYHTGFIGKWGVGYHPPYRYFDVWKGFTGQGDYIVRGRPPRHLTDVQTDQALRFIREAPENKPFLLTLAYKAPHVPLLPQKRFMPLYAAINIPRSSTDTVEFGTRVPGALSDSDTRGAYKRAHFDNDEVYQKYMRQYYQLISGMDESIGKVIDLLKVRNQLESTLIIFTSDNGMMLGDHQLLGKFCMYEESIRVPLLMRLPAEFYPPSAQINREDLVLNIDLAPTLLEAAGAELPLKMQGSSLLALLKPGYAWRDDFFYEEHYDKKFKKPRVPCTGIRTAEWKYARYQYHNYAQEMLINLREDPAEVNNLAYDEKYTPIKERLHERMQELEKEAA